MMRQSFIIDLLEDCVFSARSATEGGHESLDHIPGASLLGAVAARLYTRLTPREAYAAFHSGCLRFHDGLPYDGHTVGYPLPQCWHHSKTEKPLQAGQLRAAAISNLLHESNSPQDKGHPIQLKQLRKGYIHDNGRFSEPRRELRMKTAIEAVTGRAAEGQLFGYDALLRGQRFATVVEADADFNPELFAQVVKTLSGKVLLGRSRSAEYGQARLSPTDLTWPEATPAETNRLTLWLLSDFAPSDASGQPTLDLNASTLDLPVGSRIIWNKTFLRTRRYSPWNAARHGFDCERLVYVAGGVITVELADRWDSGLLSRLQAGIGLHREAGLGQLWVNPGLLNDFRPRFTKAPDATLPATPPRPQHPLIDWLEAQNSDWKAAAESTTRELEQQYLQALEQARRMAGIPPQATDFGPSKAQWGRVLNVARRSSGTKLQQALFEGDGAAVKSSMPGWNVTVCNAQGQWVMLSEWLRDSLGDPQRTYAYLVRRLAHRIRDDIDQRRV